MRDWNLGRRQTRTFTYIDDCLEGIDRIMHCDDLSAKPIAEEIGGVKLQPHTTSMRLGA